MTFKPADLGQIGDERFRHAVGEIFLSRFAGKILQGKDRDGVGSAGSRWRRGSLGLIARTSLRRRLRIANFAGEKIHQMDLPSVLDFVCADFVKMRMPARIRSEIVGHSL